MRTRIDFVPYPAYGHVLPMLAVAEELVLRGVRVRVVVDSRFSELVAAAGAEPISPAMRADVYVPARIGGVGTGRYLAGRVRKRLVDRHTRHVVADLLAGEWADLTVVDPAVRAVNRFLSGSGAPAVLFSTTFLSGNGLRAARRERLALVNAIRCLQPGAAPEGARFVGPLLPKFTDLGDTSDLVYPQGDPVLYVSPGTVWAWTPAYMRAVVAAFAGSRWRVVVATGPVDPTMLGNLPDNVIARRFMPQQAVLARSSVFLTHAGMNSSLEALAAGVPMVVRPRAADQRHIAKTLVRLEVAVRAPRTVADLRGAVESVAADAGVRAAVGVWRERLARHTPVSDAADLLLDFVEHGQGARTGRARSGI
ncbi:glycosyltransferase [Actinokineospora auranticolor]|uniref:MGT family glycosyltransferase n=1 Tax=Actinokineospora auranticolor TaxID=155976 RepID=A0A2S6GC54_9PSEU|nr:nucleotide disphospho-sugar-binding domain-containing protein [Actinokineospora auranticolor]PPK62034.1 MGT family glycosyltransferase [Actinokineospora auranticolor]